MMRIQTSLLCLCAACALPAAAQNVVEANTALLQAEDSVPVSRIPDGIFLRNTNDPNDIIWDRLPEYRVNLALAPAVHESVELRVNYDDPGFDAYLNLARTSDRLYVRMRWRDDTLDDATTLDRFRDAAAVQFSLGDDLTSYLMGTGPDEAVNIWYWKADSGDGVQNLAAGGYGSTTILPTQSVSGEGQYDVKDGDPNEWTVVMSRPLPVAGDYEVSFRRAEIPIAFAIWQGSEGQRDGFKYVSDGWVLLDLSED